MTTIKDFDPRRAIRFAVTRIMKLDKAERIACNAKVHEAVASEKQRIREELNAELLQKCEGHSIEPLMRAAAESYAFFEKDTEEGIIEYLK